MSGDLRNAPDPLEELWATHRHVQPAAQAVFLTLREAILSGRLPAGTRLGEEEIAARLATSRTPVREAVFRLETQSLVERLARRGVIVAQVTPDEIVEVYYVRQAMDSLAARLAAHAALPSHLIILRRVNDELRDAADAEDYAAMAAMNIRFHEALCEASRNALLLHFVRQVHDRVRRFPGTTFSEPKRAHEAVEEHSELIEALVRRDAIAAERIASDHMGRAMNVRMQMITRIHE